MEHVVIVEGNGFGNVASPHDRMTVDGVAMTLLSLTDTEAKFATSGVLDFVSNDIQVIFAEGLPRGYNAAIEGQHLQLDQKSYKITPNSGAVGGTKITVSITAVGTESDLSEATVQAQISGEWVDICDDITLVKYGTLSCTTF